MIVAKGLIYLIISHQLLNIVFPHQLLIVSWSVNYHYPYLFHAIGIKFNIEKNIFLLKYSSCVKSSWYSTATNENNIKNVNECISVVFLRQR